MIGTARIIAPALVLLATPVYISVRSVTEQPNGAQLVRHPILNVLSDEGRTTSWLARKAGFSRVYLSRVFHGRMPATPAVRLACALALGRAEGDLFHASPTTNEPAAKNAA